MAEQSDGASGESFTGARVDMTEQSDGALGESVTGARVDWTARIGRRSGSVVLPGPPVLDPPAGLRASPGRGQVTLTWEPVDGAVGYLIHTGKSRDGPWEPLNHHGGDVLAVPHPPYADTTGELEQERWYAVAAVSDVDTVGLLSAGRSATPRGADSSGEPWAVVQLVVDAGASLGELPRPWEPMIGSEHLSYLLSTDEVGGRPVGAELRAALALARDTWGVRGVRAHAILDDSLGVYREVDGAPVHDFTGVDRVYDALLELGLRPIVELSFMPRDLARDPSSTVFTYGAIVSPPKDWDRWGALVHDLAAHLVERYGLAEVREHWAFELWNEANLEVFWSGTPEEYWRLYDVSAAAVKAVDDGLRFGGPATAAAAWVDHLLVHVATSGAALDFLSTHTYGSPPLDLRPALARHGRAGAPVWWTEWGVTPTHFNPINDGVLSAAFLLRGMRSALGRVEALAYWVISDHFEELGRPPALLHGGFGLLTVGNLRKPRFWALDLLGRLGPERLHVVATGDGADSLVESVATRDPSGTVSVLVWNSTLDQSQPEWAPLLERHVRLRVVGLDADRYSVRHFRVGPGQSDVRADWARISGRDPWPNDDQWTQLHEANTLTEEPTESPVRTESGIGGIGLELQLELPMPTISFLQLAPLTDPDGVRD